MTSIYIGFVGPIATGKGVLVDHLKDLGFRDFSLSNKLRDEAHSRGIKITRENLQDLGDHLRATYGNQILAERVAFDLIGEKGNIVIDSIRNPGEVEYLRSFNPNIKIIGIDAPIDKRIVWYTKRAMERGEDNPDMSAFIDVSLRDRGVDQAENGQQVDQCLKIADIVLENSGTISDIIYELNKYLRTELNFDPEIRQRRHKEK